MLTVWTSSLHRGPACAEREVHENHAERDRDAQAEFAIVEDLAK